MGHLYSYEKHYQALEKQLQSSNWGCLHIKLVSNGKDGISFKNNECNLLIFFTLIKFLRYLIYTGCLFKNSFYIQ